jgi:hypothetical protein
MRLALPAELLKGDLVLLAFTLVSAREVGVDFFGERVWNFPVPRPHDLPDGFSGPSEVLVFNELDIYVTAQELNSTPGWIVVTSEPSLISDQVERVAVLSDERLEPRHSLVLVLLFFTCPPLYQISPPSHFSLYDILFSGRLFTEVEAIEVVEPREHIEHGAQPADEIVVAHSSEIFDLQMPHL